MKILSRFVLLCATACSFGQVALPPLTPMFEASHVLSAASLSPQLSPGMVIMITGQNLSDATAEADVSPLPSTLAGVTVLAGTRAIPMLMASPGEIHAQLPWDLATGATVFRVRTTRAESAPVTVTLKRAAPSLITDDNGRAVAVGSDGLLISDARPARAGEQVTLYAAGLGPVDARIAAGAVNPQANTTLPVEVLVGPQKAQVLQSRLVTDMSGTYEIVIRMPRVGFGVFPVRVTVDAQLAPVSWLSLTTGFDPGIDDLCAQAPVTGGEVFLPPQATEVSTGFEDFVSGLVNQLYPGVDTGLESWYSNFDFTSDGCPVSVETGDLPTEPDDPDEDPIDELLDPGIDDWLKDLETALQQIAALRATSTGIVPVVANNFQYVKPPNPCAVAAGQGAIPFCRALAASPFQGKDIIYVHGLSVSTLQQLLKGDAPQPWTGDLGAALYSSWFQALALKGWDTHIDKFLVSRGAKNRYLAVGWSSAERMEKAANAVLWQIGRAMISGSGVNLLDNADPRGTTGFCSQGCVLISHSTGGPLTDVAMALAADPAYQASAGPTGFIPQNMLVHVAFGGAFAGSRYAGIATAISRGLVAATNLGCRIISELVDFVQPDCAYDNLKDTILVDLTPNRMQTVWGPWIAKTPVKTLTVAGGNHESMWPFKKWFLAGLDDGVVSMDSSCARQPGDTPAGTFPVAFPMQFDRGMLPSQTLRAFRYWSEQKGGLLGALHLPWRMAAGCTPYKTPWGMIFKPIWWTEGHPLQLYPNHYAFLQTAENHGGSRRIWSQKDGLIAGESPELEDVLAVSDPLVYSSGLVKSSIKGQVQEQIRGRVIRFKLFGHKHKLYVWKRTYHRLSGWDTLPAAEYVYRYVL